MHICIAYGKGSVSRLVEEGEVSSTINTPKTTYIALSFI